MTIDDRLAAAAWFYAVAASSWAPSHCSLVGALGHRAQSGWRHAACFSRWPWERVGV
jgi:hypothetical protein